MGDSAWLTLAFLAKHALQCAHTETVHVCAWGADTGKLLCVTTCIVHVESEHLCEDCVAKIGIHLFVHGVLTQESCSVCTPGVVLASVWVLGQLYWAGVSECLVH